MARKPASVQPVEAVTARLLARPILQEYDAFTVDERDRNPINQFKKQLFGRVLLKQSAFGTANRGDRNHRIFI